jgi:hypothetical protein
LVAHLGQKLGEGSLFGLPLGEPDVVGRHGMATPTTEAAQTTVSVPELNPRPPFQTGLSTAALWFAP